MKDQSNETLINSLISKLLSVSSDDFEKDVAYSRLISLGYDDASLLEHCLLTGRVVNSPIPKKKVKASKKKRVQ